MRQWRCVVNKAKLNYWLDAAIGVSFLLSAISGLVFLLPIGFSSDSRILGLSYQAWDDLHTWSSLAMIAGVVLHLVLHWRWIISMTRRMLQKPSRVSHPGRVGTVPQVVWIDAGAKKVNRRDFLRLIGVAAAGIGLGMLGYRAICVAGSPAMTGDVDGERVLPPVTDQPGLQEADGERTLPVATEQVPQQDAEAEEAQSVPAPAAAPTVAPTEAQEVCVACPRGLVNDPYPGQCRRYIDTNDNGICDLSESGSGNNCL
jgi:hypothetical protein